MHKRKQPVKLWYLSSFFRHERAQAGRYRQFWQVVRRRSVRRIRRWTPSRSRCWRRCWTEMSVRDVRLRLSSLGSKESRGEYRERLQAHLRAHEASLSEEVRGRIELNPLRAFDSDHEGTKRGDGERAASAGSPQRGGRRALRAGARPAGRGASVAYEIDPTLVRGLDYYTRTVFEFTSDALGAQSGVGGGGRYDGLVELLGGAPTPGIGWAAGIERILLAGDAAAGRGEPAGAVRGARRGLARESEHGEGSSCDRGRVCAAERGALGRADGPDGARRTLAEGPAGLRERARRALRGDRGEERRC